MLYERLTLLVVDHPPAPTDFGDERRKRGVSGVPSFGLCVRGVSWIRVSILLPHGLL